MACCIFWNNLVNQKVILQDENGHYALLVDGSKQYYISCPFCGNNLPEPK